MIDIILDSAELADAAEMLAIPHCPGCRSQLDPVALAGVACSSCGAELDDDYPQICRDTAVRLMRVAAAAQRSRRRGDNRWPVISVQVQGTCEIPQCRVCGCLELAACSGGCSWVEPDLCSRCAT